MIFPLSTFQELIEFYLVSYFLCWIGKCIYIYTYAKNVKYVFLL